MIASMRILAAALAAGAASAVTVSIFSDSACTVPGLIPSITAYTDVCSPQLNAGAAKTAAPAHSFAATSVTGGGTSAITSATVQGFVGTDCTGAASIAMTVTTACAVLPGVFSSFYAKLSTTDTLATAASVGGGYYAQIFAAAGSANCADITMAADTPVPAMPCMPSGVSSTFSNVVVSKVSVAMNSYSDSKCSTSVGGLTYPFGTCTDSTGVGLCKVVVGTAACSIKTAALAPYTAPAPAKSGEGATAALGPAAALALALAAALAAAF